MSYSLKAHPNQQDLFPKPPEWLVWRSNVCWDSKNQKYLPQPLGQVRHFPALQKCKRYVSPYGSNPFYADWSIYRWDPDSQEYLLQFSGKTGENKEDNILFQMRIRKDESVRELNQNEIDAAIESIKQAATP